MTAQSESFPSPAQGPTAPALERVCVLIVNYNSGQWLGRCLRALKGTGARLPDIRILDNASVDGSVDDLPDMPGVQIIRSEENLGFGPGVNRLASEVEHEFILILNPDCLLVAKSLERLIQEMDAWPDTALVSGRIFDMSGDEQRGSRRQLPSPGRLRNEVLKFHFGSGVDLTHLPPPRSACEVEAVSGACMLIRTSVFNSLDGFDVGFPMHFEDLDLMARIGEASHAIRLVPDVAISHAGGVSSQHRPVQVELDKHRGLWRYLVKHCRSQWPWWSRPLWAAAIALHFLLIAPLALLRR
ncbi:MAG: glycosyltransferase family 2 protein [Pseudomonadota bacterium]